MSAKKIAILVAAAKYPKTNGALQDLRCPPADADGMQSVLRDQKFGGFSTVKVLKDQEHHVALNRINQELNTAERDDLVLVYYSGHGKLDLDGDLHLTSVNTEIPLLTTTSIPVAALKQLIRQSRSQRIIVILDCCYAGAVGGVFTKGSVDDQVQKLSRDVSRGKGMFIMTSSTAIEQSTEKEGDQYSVFTKHIIEGIRTGAADANQDGVITMDEIFNYVHDKVIEEARHEPMRWDIGATGPLVIARSQGRMVDKKQRDRIRKKIEAMYVVHQLPRSIRERALVILEKAAEDIERMYEAQWGLLVDLTKEEHALQTGEFIDQWFHIENELPHSGERSSVDKSRRWDHARFLRGLTFDVIGPSYLLDATYHFLDWNPAFDEIVARQLGLMRGRHAEDFVLALKNSTQVVERSIEVFAQGKAPLVDIEVLEFQSDSYGLIKFQKIAAQIPDDEGRVLAWTIHLDVLHADRVQHLWEDIHRRLRREVNWSKYAVSYDKLLLNFDEYGALLEQTTGMIGSGKIADLASGTGNGTIRLLQADPSRKVWAFDENERMLEYFREKLDDKQLKDRVTIIKGDLLLSLREIEEAFFDSAIMINALYAMDDRQECLREIYRVLKPDGVLVMSTSHSRTDVDRLFEAIRVDLDNKGLLKELRWSLENALERHQEMDRLIHKDTKENIRQYVESAGFEIAEFRDPAYVGAVVVVKAVKK